MQLTYRVSHAPLQPELAKLLGYFPVPLWTRQHINHQHSFKTPILTSDRERRDCTCAIFPDGSSVAKR